PLVMKPKGEPLLASSSLSDSLLAGVGADSKSTSSEGVCCPAVRNRAFDPGMHPAPLDIRKQLLMLLCGDNWCACCACAVASSTTAPASMTRILLFMRHFAGEVGTDRVGRSTRHATHIQQQAYRERAETPDYNQLFLSRSKPLLALTNALAQPHVQSQFAACFTSSSISVLVPARLQMAAQHVTTQHQKSSSLERQFQLGQNCTLNRGRKPRRRFRSGAPEHYRALVQSRQRHQRRQVTAKPAIHEHDQRSVLLGDSHGILRVCHVRYPEATRYEGLYDTLQHGFVAADREHVWPGLSHNSPSSTLRRIDSAKYATSGVMSIIPRFGMMRLSGSTIQSVSL